MNIVEFEVGSKVRLIKLPEDAAQIMSATMQDTMMKNLNNIGTVEINDYGLGGFVCVKFPDGFLVECLPNELQAITE